MDLPKGKAQNSMKHKAKSYGSVSHLWEKQLYPAPLCLRELVYAHWLQTSTRNSSMNFKS